MRMMMNDDEDEDEDEDEDDDDDDDDDDDVDVKGVVVCENAVKIPIHIYNNYANHLQSALSPLMVQWKLYLK